MNGGKISGNIGTESGGVYVSGGTFTMKGGEISGNNTHRYGYGGGVYLDSGTFTMEGGEISGNSIRYGYGGGVYIEDRYGRYSIINKTGGIIYGYDGTDNAQNNTVKDSSGGIVNNKGHAVYVYGAGLRKETTVGPADKLYLNDPVEGTAGW
jgi:hypothetical protein